MHQKFGVRVLALALSVTLFGAGCGAQIASGVHIDEIQSVTQEIKLPTLESDMKYEIPVCSVHVLVDRNGYQSKRSKKALFVGDNLANEFDVINADTKEIVYTGEIQEAVEDSTNHVKVWVGDFSDVTEAGRYYIETAKIGRSYPFEVADDIENTLLHNMILSAHAISYDETPQETQQLALCMYAYLQALQFHGSIFDKDSELVTWLLKAASLIMKTQTENGSVGDDFQSTAAFCGTMRMCAHNFEKYDTSLAASYKKAADQAWDWILKHTTQREKDSDALFYASAALFHDSQGTEAQSREIVLSYFEAQQGHLTDSYFDIFGSIIYLSTEKGTDRDLCHTVMKELVNQTEKICEKQKEHPYLIYDFDPDENLKQLLLICFVDYVSPSNEYAVVMENSIHYYGGRNYNGKIYLSLEGNWEDEEYVKSLSPIWGGVMINCLGSLIDDND